MSSKKKKQQKMKKKKKKSRHEFQGTQSCSVWRILGLGAIFFPMANFIASTALVRSSSTDILCRLGGRVAFSTGQLQCFVLGPSPGQEDFLNLGFIITRSFQPEIGPLTARIAHSTCWKAFPPACPRSEVRS